MKKPIMSVRFANWRRALENHFRIKAGSVEILPDKYTQSTHRVIFRSFTAAVDHYAHAIGSDF